MIDHLADTYARSQRIRHNWLAYGIALTSVSIATLLATLITGDLLQLLVLSHAYGTPCALSGC
ncbi:hypothetical protein [Puniceibacterium confluentis]|uniref:hypothetical protein n=1 Tax=Puniceibacterium confluentis TaxID=1958944 RepID=UPI0011B4C80A|nr:hypothetical protein [Puniceibacterium confluentis]